MKERAQFRRRETVVTLTLTTVVGIGMFLFLQLIGGAFVLSFLVTAAALTMAGVFHYLVWGRAFSRDRDENGNAADGVKPTAGPRKQWGPER
jgi:hypothetical protein